MLRTGAGLDPAVRMRPPPGPDPKKLSAVAELRQAVSNAIGRSGMPPDDIAMPALMSCLDVVLRAMAARRAATRAVVAQSRGDIPDKPLDVVAMSTELKTAFGKQLPAAGMQRDVIGVFLSFVVEASFAIMKDSFTLHTAAHAMALGKPTSSTLYGVPRIELPSTPVEPQETGHSDLTTPRIDVFSTIAIALIATACLTTILHEVDKRISTNITAMFASAANDRAFWQAVFDENDSDLVEKMCIDNQTIQQGRHACTLMIWFDPKPKPGGIR